MEVAQSIYIYLYSQQAFSNPGGTTLTLPLFWPEPHLRHPRPPHHGYFGRIGEDGRRAHGAVVAYRSEIHLVYVEVKSWTDLTIREVGPKHNKPRALNDESIVYSVISKSCEAAPFHD